MEESAINPRCIAIEVTESVAMGDAAAIGETMSESKSLGVNLSIDDLFGSTFFSEASMISPTLPNSSGEGVAIT